MKTILYTIALIGTLLLTGCGNAGNEQTDNLPIVTTKDSYVSNESITVKVQGELSGDQDWVGVFSKEADNSWSNVVVWDFIPKKGTFALTTKLKPMPAGEYEVRLFWHNEYGADAVARGTYGFHVVADDGFGQFGDYEVGVDNTHDNEHYYFYYPKDKSNAPVVFFLSASTGGKYEGYLHFLASQGYFVIEQRWNSNTRTVSILEEDPIKKYQVNADKIIFTGNSQGSAFMYSALKAMKEKNHAEEANGIVSIDGYFARYMNIDDINALNTKELIFQFGGNDSSEKFNDEAGEPYHFQDPNIHLALYKILKDTSEVELYPMKANHLHSYFAGTIDSVHEKEDFFRPLHAFIEYALGNVEKNDVQGILKMNSQDEIYNDIHKAREKAIKEDNPKKEHLANKKGYLYECKETIGNNKYDYCNPDNPMITIH